jgi:amidophosphoribosyltransferase
MKLNPLNAVIRGKRLVVVDDSIVRGNTTGKLVDMLFSAGAKEVHLRISSPPIQYPCFYGIDMATRAELIAANLSVEEIRARVGATSLHYLTLGGLQASTGLPRDQFCRACFDGDYPIAVPEEYSMCKMRFEKGAAASVCEP